MKEFISLFSKISLMPEVESVFKELRRQGFKRVLISSGIPVIALKDLAGRLVIDQSEYKPTLVFRTRAFL